VAHKQWNILHYVEQAAGLFVKRLLSIIAVKVSGVEHFSMMFNMTSLHCNDLR